MDSLLAVLDDDRISGRVGVLPGGVVTRGSIAGTGCVVMKDDPQVTILAETPARPVRYRSRHSSSHRPNLPRNMTWTPRHRAI